MSRRVDPHLKESDAFSWYMERDPLLRSTVVAVLVFDRAPDQVRLLRRLERASRIVPGLRHRLVEPPLRLAPPRWTVDPSFDLSWHVRRVEAPAPKDIATVFAFARKEGMAGFDTARPLWSWTTVDGLEGGGAAAILKMHHSLTDGIGGMRLATELFDLASDAPEPDDAPAVPAPESPSRAGVLFEALGYDLQCARSRHRRRAPRRCRGARRAPSGRVGGGRRPHGAIGRADGGSDLRHPVAGHARASPRVALRRARHTARRSQARRTDGGRHAQRRVPGRDRRGAPALPRASRQRRRGAAGHHADQHPHGRRPRRRQSHHPDAVPGTDRRDPTFAAACASSTTAPPRVARSRRSP